MRMIVLILPVSLLAGCTNLNGLVTALKDDPATVSASVMTPYGSLKFVRTNPHGTNQTVTVSPDGTVVIKSP